MPRVVLDTNVLVAALRSADGASYRLISLLSAGVFEPVASVALVMEYQEVLLRHKDHARLEPWEIEAFLDYFCVVAHHQKVFYLWRPGLRDPGDDMILELAVASGADTIVSFNERHFVGSERFGVRVLPPAAFLREIGELP